MEQVFVKRRAVNEGDGVPGPFKYDCNIAMLSDCLAGSMSCQYQINGELSYGDRSIRS